MNNQPKWSDVWPTPKFRAISNWTFPKFEAKTFKCPQCKHGILDLMHDRTGMYYRCERCKYEYPN